MSSFTLTVAGFAVVTAALVALETFARRRETWPNIGDVFTALAGTGTGRFLVVLGWWWLGWHFFVR